MFRVSELEQVEVEELHDEFSTTQLHAALTGLEVVQDARDVRVELHIELQMLGDATRITVNVHSVLLVLDLLIEVNNYNPYCLVDDFVLYVRSTMMQNRKNSLVLQESNNHEHHCIGVQSVGISFERTLIPKLK